MRLNPFDIRAQVGRRRPIPLMAEMRLNPFDIRAQVGQIARATGKAMRS